MVGVLKEGWWQVIHITDSHHDTCFRLVHTIHRNHSQIKLKTKRNMQIKKKNRKSKQKLCQRKIGDKTLLKASKLTPDSCKSNLEHSFGQISVILLRDLCLIGGPVKYRGVVVDIIDVNHHCCVVFVQIV